MNNFTIIDIKTGFEMLPYTAIQEAAYENIYAETLKRKDPVDLAFDEEGHCYKLDGALIPSVTQILKGVGVVDFSRVPFERLEAAQKFGTAVHKACELYDLNKLDERSLDSNLWAYLDAWVSFRKDYKLEFTAIEQPIISVVYKVAGTPDRVAKSEKIKRLAVLLNEEGNYKVTEYKDKNDWQVFLACLSVYNWKVRNK